MVNDYFTPIYCILPKKCVVKEISISKRWIRNLHGEHEIRTPKGLRIGNRSVVDGKNMLQIKRGGCEDYISAESLVERIHGLPVKSIEFITEEDQRKDA